MTVTISLFISLTAHWQSLYHSTKRVPYITLLLSTGPWAVPISLHYTLLAHWQSIFFIQYSTGTLTVATTLYDTLLDHWQSLYHSTKLAHLQSICHSTKLYWHADSPYIALQ